MADYYTLLTDAGIAYETACKAAGTASVSAGKRAMASMLSQQSCK